MEEMIDEIMAVMLWQTDSSHHPLTCGNIECDSWLLPSVEAGCIVLKCPCCSFQQDSVPLYVISSYHELIEGRVFREDSLKIIGNIKSS